MKTKPHFSRPAIGLISAVATVALAAGWLPALAQPNPDNRPARQQPPADARRGDRLPGGGPFAWQPGRYAPFLERVLTEEQRTSLREAMEAQRDKMRELEEKLRDARREMFHTGLAEKFDEDKVRKTALEVGKLDAELAVLRARAFSKMKPPLSAEQIEKLKNPPPLEGGEPRPELRRDDRPRGERPQRGPRDENDLPPAPKPER
jgi:Spy/CpxP family protein refolding chaperone